jgi:hypothetical protein
MISINAKPFYEGMRFRSGGYGEDSIKEECQASECTLICQDLWKRGYHKIAVDPLVKVYYDSYNSENSKEFEKAWFLDYSEKDKELHGKTNHISWKSTPPISVHCCPLIDPNSYSPKREMCRYYRLNF